MARENLNQFKIWPLIIALPLIALSNFSFLADPYVSSKWIIYYLLSFICICILIPFSTQKKTIILPKISPFIYASILLLVLFLSINIISNWHVPIQIQLLDWTCFTVMAFLSYKFLQTKTQLNKLLIGVLLGSLAVAAYGLIQYFIPKLNPSFDHNSFPSSTFGFQNMTAEFVTVSIIIGLILLTHTKKSISKFLLSISLFFLLVYLHMLASRAAFLSLFLSYLSYLVLLKKKRWLILHCLILIAANGCFNLIETIPKIKEHQHNPPRLPQAGITRKNTQKTDSIFSSSKSANTQKRFIRWANTLSMIKQNPLGTGIGNYEFSYIEYNNYYKQDPESTETLLPRSPHNAYLELFAEYGIPAGLIILLLIFLYIKKIFLLKTADPLKKYIRIIMIPLFILYISNAFVNFPLENALPFSLASIFLGLGFKCIILDKDTYTIKLNTTILYIIPLVIISFTGFRVISSKVLEGKRNDPIAAKNSCNLSPGNWRSCLNYARLEIENKYYWNAIKIHKKMLYHYPNNYMSMRSLSYIYYVNGNKVDACKYWNQYKKMLKEQPPKFNLQALCSRNIKK